MEKLIKFNPSVAEAKKIAEKYVGLKITDPADKGQYDAVFNAQQELKGIRTSITRYGKEARQEAIRWQKEVISQEKELLEIIKPVEDALKSERDRVDIVKKREARRILLPTRKALLEDIGAEWTDDEILDMDEKEFASEYEAAKAVFELEVETKRMEREREKRRQEEIEQAKKDAAEKAKKEAEEKAEREKKEEAERVEREKKEAEQKKKEELEAKEREKQEAIEKVKREAAEKERKRKEKEAREKREAEEKERKEREEREKTEKNKKYQGWLKKNGVTNTNIGSFHIERRGTDSGGKTLYVLFKIIDQITI